MKGLNVQPSNPTKDKLNLLETKISNVETATRLTQLMIQQLMSNNKSLAQDLNNLLNQLYELQYKFIALQKALNVDSNKLNEIANAQRLIDFDEASKKQDIKDSLNNTDTVTENSVITITSSAIDTTGVDVGIFRSRLKLAESGVPDLIKGLLGKKVGDKVTIKLNNTDHNIELLSIKEPSVEAGTQSVNV